MEGKEVIQHTCGNILLGKGVDLKESLSRFMALCATYTANTMIAEAHFGK